MSAIANAIEFIQENATAEGGGGGGANAKRKEQGWERVKRVRQNKKVQESLRAWS